MVSLKQFKKLANETKKRFSDVFCHGDLDILFLLNGKRAVLHFKVTDPFIQNPDESEGTIILSYGNDKTEFDSLRYAVDAIDSLAGHPFDKYDDVTIPETDDTPFDPNEPIDPSLIDFNSVKDTKTPVMEAEMNRETVDIDDFPTEYVANMLDGNGWYDYIAYYGKDAAKETFKEIDDYMIRNGLAGIQQPDDEDFDNEHYDRPAFGGGIGGPDEKCIHVVGIKGQWEPLMEIFADELADDDDDDDDDDYDIEQSVGRSIDTAMMDHYDMMNGDIGDFESVKDTKTPVMEAEMTTEEIINKPDDVIEIDPTAMTSNSDPLVEYLKGLESFNGWDPTDIQMWARDNHDAIQEYYNQCKNLDQAIQMCLDDEKDKFYQDFNKYESVRGTNQKVFCESVTKLCEKAGHPEIGEAVVKLMEAIEAAECNGDCVQLDEEPNFDVTIAVDTLDPNPAHYRVAGYDAMDALEKVANDLKAKGHVGYFEDNPTYEEDYYEVAGTFIPSWLVNIEKIA